MLDRRIRLLSVIASSDLGGAERNLVSLLGALDPSVYDISIACHGAGPMLEEYRGVAARVRPFDLVHIWRLAAVPALASWMRSIHCDVVHTHLWTADVLGGLAAALVRVPVRIASVRGHYFLPVEMAGGVRWRRALLSRGYRAVYPLFDRVIAVAPSIATDLTTRPGFRVRRESVEVVPNGIDPDEVARPHASRPPQLPASRPLVVCVANFFPVKGHTVLLQAMRTVAARHPGAHLLLVGDGPARTDIEALVSRLDLARQVTLVGARPDSVAFTAAADLVVLPSWSEGTPRALLEALALEKPVVATAVGGVPDLVRDGMTGRLVPPGAPEVLAGAMDDLLSDPARGERLGRMGREHVGERFSVAGSARQTDALYRRLLAGEVRSPESG